MSATDRDGPEPDRGQPDPSLPSPRVSRRELRWLACREKACCHAPKVVVTGRDLWRIATALEVAPWDVTRQAPAGDGAPDGFRLEPEGPANQVVLRRRGKASARSAPCVFLWKLADGHAQCGLGATRPLACRARPALAAGCGCGPCSPPTPESDRDGAPAAEASRELAEYREIVAAWNRGIAETGAARTYRDFCNHVMAAYGSTG